MPETTGARKWSQTTAYKSLGFIFVFILSVWEQDLRGIYIYILVHNVKTDSLAAQNRNVTHKSWEYANEELNMHQNHFK